MMQGQELIVADIGGTHARFARARVATGRVEHLGDPITYQVAEYPDLAAAWAQLARDLGGHMPRAVAIALAGPVGDHRIKMTNGDWVFDLERLHADLDIDDHLLMNDFVAVGHAVAQADSDDFIHLAGPDAPLPTSGTISIVGPGTGLGVAHVYRDGSYYRVNPTEGGHISFAPRDALEDALLVALRARHGRVSAERAVAGPAIVDLYRVLASRSGLPAPLDRERAVWQAALEGSDPLAVAAAEHFCTMLGHVASDILLAQGGCAVVIAGGLGFRLRAFLARPGFAEAFADKGRFRAMLAEMPVKLITTAEPGLFGAAAAYAQRIASC